MRTNTTSLPCAASASARSDEKAIAPLAAPGEAGRPLVKTFIRARGSSVGCSKCSSEAGSIRSSASVSSIMPSATISTAILIAASTVRFPARACRINTRPFCTVNSTSCISLKWLSRRLKISTNSPCTSGNSSSKDKSSICAASRAALVR